MPPPRASSADTAAPASQTPEQITSAIDAFLSAHPDASVLEDGKPLFDLRSAKYSLATDHGRCTLHLWSEDRNLTRSILSATPRGDGLRLATRRLGHAHSKLLDLVSSTDTNARRTPTTRDTARTRYLRLLERVLERNLPAWRPEGFRAAMDLERSFGPAYARGTLVHGNQAFAVIGVGAHESPAIIDGILTLGILWLHHCREHAAGRRLFQGLHVIVPRGSAALTLSRMAWLRPEAAQWQLSELDERSEELTPRDLADQGNLRTALIHHPDPAAAHERFARAIDRVLALIPAQEHHRVEQRLRSTAELAFLLHGLEFARARISLAPGTFTHTLELTVGIGPAETPVTPATRDELTGHLAELFARRSAAPSSARHTTRVLPAHRRIGAPSLGSAHSRLPLRQRSAATATLHPVQDPLFRAAPERWLESVLRQDLAPLTRGLAPRPSSSTHSDEHSATDPDPDTIGNRIEAPPTRPAQTPQQHSRILPRLDPAHVYAQVPAIAGASDRGLLDLLGVTADGRLAVLELKADDDLHFALQGLDYWIRVRQHHMQPVDSTTGLGEFHRHGYFRGVELSPLAPRLYLVAPALRIHPATETVLRYLSPQVEWQLLALDERWRDQIRVVWRKSSH